MITVFAILIGAAFIYVGFKKRFFVMWAMLFNLFVSIYLAVMFVHAIAKSSPDIGSNGYFLALCLLALTALIYAILHIVVKFYVIGSNDIEFPMLFDKIGAGLLGFIFGYLVCCVVLFSIGIMPVAKHEAITNVLGNNTLAAITAPPVKKVCNFMGAVTLQCDPEKGDAVINWLMQVSDKQKTPKLESGSARDDIAKELAADDFEVESIKETIDDPNE